VGITRGFIKTPGFRPSPILLDLCIEIYFRLFLLFHRKSASQDPKIESKNIGINTYSSDKKGTSVAQFWLSFYADAYSFPFFSTFFGFIAETRPRPFFLILEPTILPNKIFLVSCIF
jgi:hypothetical protein